MTTPTHNPTTHRLAAATTLVALLPIVIGALVTTLHAGMAFLDWPTSDGQNMLTYNLLHDIRMGNVKKVVEHGHRLAGMVIGCFGLVLTAVAWSTANRRSVRWLATAALLGIIAEGLLGGLRVIQNERLLALLHGQFAAVVFSLLAVTWLVSGRTWSRVGSADHGADENPTPGPPATRSERWAQPTLLALAIVTPVVLVLQYVLGGLLRHLGTAMFEHLGLAVLAFGLVVATAVTALTSGHDWLKRSGWSLLAIVHVQVALGIVAFVTKYGFTPTGYVAVRGTSLQLLTASAHTVVGMLLVASSVVCLVKVLRVSGVTRAAGTDRLELRPTQHAANIVPGGVG